LIAMGGAGLRIGRYRIAPGVAPFSFQPIYAPAWSRRPARRAGWQSGAPAQSSPGASPSGLPPDILALIRGGEPPTHAGADWTAGRQADAPDDWPASLSSGRRESDEAADDAPIGPAFAETLLMARDLRRRPTLGVLTRRDRPAPTVYDIR